MMKLMMKYFKTVTPFWDLIVVALCAKLSAQSLFFGYYTTFAL